VRYFRQENAGASAARNAAFSVARGRWLIYFDADDLSCPGSLAAMMQVARLHPKDIVHCRWSKVDQHPNNMPAKSVLWADMPGSLWVERAFLYDYPTYPGCFVLPRSLIEEVGGWNEQLTFQNDIEFYARVISRVEMIRFCAEAVFVYRQCVPGSVSNTIGRGSSESHYLATILAVQHLLSVRNTRSARAGAVRQLMLVGYTQYLAAPDISRKAETYAKSLAVRPFWRPWLPGGPKRRVLQAAFGWKLALKAHFAIRKLKQ
jgi:glycosyltransferase involved in cell wall biosynthesis